MSSSMSLLFTFLLLGPAVAMPGAMPWLGPMPTPMSLMATAGFSPRPTGAPGSNGIPQELRRRQNLAFPPPDNWCGLVEGLSDDILSCSAGLTCINSFDAIGCCTATTGICTDLYTACANYDDTCDRDCKNDDAVIKCSESDLPYCGTYSFYGGSTLFNCDSTTALPYSVEFLNDYYITAIGSTIASDPSTDPFGFTAAVTQTQAADTASATGASATAESSSESTSRSFGSPSSSSSSSGGGGGLSAGAIDGIAAAAAIIGVAILAAIIFFCVRQRKRKRLAASAAPFPNAHTQQPPPIQAQAPMQQQQSPPPKAFDGYQPVPQQTQPQPQPYTQYPTPPPQFPSPAQQQQQQQTYFPPPATPISPQTTGGMGSPHTTDPRFSTASPSILSPTSETGDSQSYYKPPLSPTITEVDATMGNPGAPNAGANGGRPLEVDGTMGNPGVPANGRAGSGPFELGHDGR